MTEEIEKPQQDENELIALRREKLGELRKQGNAYPNDFRRNAYAADLHSQFGEIDNETLLEAKHRVKVAGRMMLCRIMGKASFIQLQDVTGRIQIYIRKNDVPEGIYDEFKSWDLGDILGIEGYLFKTKTGELSVHAQDIRLLTKALRPLPDKFHGLADKEACYRQRYLDLIANDNSMDLFKTRIKIVDCVRKFLKDRRFYEVETPMMHVIPGGAAAKPFTTHHNALDIPLYLRIAPELYLKRLIVGGFDRVFEINRSFRNEGLSYKHNPEFTMLEFYQAYADYNDLINLTEEMMKAISKEVLSTSIVEYQGHTIDFSKPFARMTLRNSLLHFNKDISKEDIDDIEKIKVVAKKHGIEVKPSYGLGKLQMELFEKTVEDNLIQPIFITQYPVEVSPLARRNDDDSLVTDRFEFFVAGREICNGFSELNDPEDQAERFRHQVGEFQAGDEEAMHYDADYITALECGMPPTAGEGIGIDRLTMLFTDSHSIRDVILFPRMKPIE